VPQTIKEQDPTECKVYIWQTRLDKSHPQPLLVQHQISWFNFEPQQSSNQMLGPTFVTNQSSNQIVSEIISGFNYWVKYSHIEKKLSLRFLLPSSAQAPALAGLSLALISISPHPPTHHPGK
jgi:hypothetical protein